MLDLSGFLFGDELPPLGPFKELVGIDLYQLHCPIRTIDDNFLIWSASLRYIDLTPLQHVQRIGDRFLYSCIDLERLDMSDFYNLDTVGDSFLSGCLSLCHVQLPPRLKKIGKSFMIGCITLRDLSFDGLALVEEIPDNFLWRTRGIDVIDLQPMRNVRKLPSEFLRASNASIVRLDMPLLTEIPDHFMTITRNLQRIDLTSMRSLVKIGTFFMASSGITAVCLPKSPHLKYVTNGFLQECSVDKSMIVWK